MGRPLPPASSIQPGMMTMRSNRLKVTNAMSAPRNPPNDEMPFQIYSTWSQLPSSQRPLPHVNCSPSMKQSAAPTHGVPKTRSGK